MDLNVLTCSWTESEAWIEFRLGHRIALLSVNEAKDMFR